MERARATAAQEERQKKLQEYLAIKGKLKCPNTKPYLKDRTNQPNPQLPRLSKSGPVVQPQKDVLSKVSKCIPKDHAPAVKNTRSARHALQHRSSNAPGSQRPKSIPPNLLGKRTGPPANLLPNKSHCVQLNRMASSSTCHQLNQIQEIVKSENPGSVTDQRAVMLTQTGNDPQCGEHHSVTENLQEMVDCDKVNLPSKTVLESSENRTESGLDIKVQSRTGLNKPESKRGLVHRHSLGTAPRNNVGLKDRVTACQISKELIWNKLAKSPPGCKVMCPQKPSSKVRGSVPPSQIFTVSSTRLSKKSGAEKQCVHPSVMRQNTVKLQAVGMLGLARQPTQKQYVKHSRTCKTPGALEVGRSKQQVRAGQDLKLTRSPINSDVSKRPSVMELKAKSKPMSERPNSKTGGTANWQMNATKGKQGIKDLKKASQTCDTKSKSTLPRNCTASTCMSRDQATVGMLRNMRETPKRELLRVKEVLGNQDPKTPAAENRKKQLEQWLASKGKSYKRPPMTLPAKKPTKEMMNLSFWNGMEKEEKRKQLCVTDKINGMLAECLELAEKGFPSEELFSTLSSIPEAEKFAKFWICKAKLLARNGTIDMTGLYEAAVCAGAAPIQELREVVVEFLKNTDNVYQGVSAHPSAEVSSHIVEDAAEQLVLQGPRTPCPGMREQVVATPQSSLRFLTSKPVSLVKLQVVPVPRMKGLSDMQDLKFLTPVRRSLRIEHAISRYPEMLKEHDTVVSSLDEIMAMEDVSQIVFRKNEALLEEEELEL